MDNTPPPPITPPQDPVQPSISSMFEDNSGGISSIRVLMLLWGAGVFIIWAAAWAVAIYHGIYTAPNIPPEVVTILLGVTGIKTVQRFGEKSS